MEEHRLKVFENRVLRRIHVFGLKRDEIIEGWKNWMRSFVTCTLHQI
jgi:hypothetical protein